MLAKIENYDSIRGKSFGKAIVFAFLMLFSAVVVAAQQPDAAQNAAQNKPKDPAAENKTPVLQPALADLLEVGIGTAAGDVREKLGKAKIDDDDGFYYEFSDERTAQIRLDADKKVQMISVTYAAGNKNAPKFTDVFGASADEAAATKPDGSVYRLVRYTESGYWVAYSRTAGDNPEITVTMQKL